MDQFFHDVKQAFGTPDQHLAPQQASASTVLTIGVFEFEGKYHAQTVIGGMPHQFDGRHGRLVYSFHEPLREAIEPTVIRLRQQAVDEARRRHIPFVRHLGDIPPA